MFPNAFIIPMSREMTISQWHVPIDDDEALLVRDLHLVRRAGRQGRDAPPAARALSSCPTTCRARTRATITASIRTSRSTRPTPAWAPTSTCTTSGPASRWARSRTAPQEHLGTSDKAISRLPPAAARRRSSRPARARSRSWCSIAAQAAGDHRPGLRRRHRPGRRLAGLLAAHRREPAQDEELDQWALTPSFRDARSARTRNPVTTVAIGFRAAPCGAPE